MKVSNGKSAIKYMVLFGLLFIANGAWAKDLFVAPTGSDSVAYDSNSITNPWASVSKAFASALAGDTVYFRTGTYNIASAITTVRGGTAGSPITFKNYNDEVVTWTRSGINAVWIEHPYIYVEGFICDGLGTGGASWWSVGYNGGTASNFKASKITGQNLGTNSDNAGFIYINDRANNAIVEYCTITGHSKGDNANVSAIFARVSTGLIIRNNKISNFPNGIYYKHPNPIAPSGIEIYGNYIYNCSLAIQSNTNYANYHDNLIIGTVAMGWNSGGNNDGGTHNIFNHNTFVGGFLTFVYDWSSQYNTVKNNLFVDTACHWHEYSGAPSAYTISDYNLFRASGYAVKESGVQYSLSTWKSHTGGDAHSLSGSPTFVGGSTPSTIAGYALTAGSLGKNAADNGSDMGADIGKVGVNSSTSTSTMTPMAQTAPANPIGLTVQ